MANQSPCFIEGTVRENINFFCPDHNPEKLIEIKNKLFDNNTDILDQNVRVLSGGELARVSALRCLVRTADIYIFDEITASLDPENASNLMNVISKELVQKTKVFIMHKDTQYIEFNKVIELTQPVNAHGN